MVMNEIFVWMLCECNLYVIPKSIRRKDLGYKGYEFLTIAIFAALLLIFCYQDIISFSLCFSSAVDLVPACLRFSNMNNSAVDSVPANNLAVDLVPALVCLRFSNMNNSAVDSVPANTSTLAVDSVPACFRFSHMNPFPVVLFPARFWRLYLLSPLLNSLFLQTTTSSSLVFAWQDQPFFLAQSRIAAFVLQLASRQSRAHNHRLLSALVNGPIDQAGCRLVSVLRGQGYLAGNPFVCVTALHVFRSPVAPAAVPSMSQLVVTEDMRIALADDIIDRTARLATISADDQPELYAMARTSLDARLQR